MKKLMLSIAALSVLSFSQAYAQQPPAAAAGSPQAQKTPATPEEEANRQTERLTRELGLSADQKSKVQALALEKTTANGPLKEKAKAAANEADKKALHQQIKANNEKFETALNALLTPDQQAKWAALKKTMEEKHNEKNNAATGTTGVTK